MRLRLSPRISAGIIALALIATAALMNRRFAARVEATKVGGSCSTCAIEVEKIVTIGDREGAGAISRPFAVVYGNGSTYVVPDPHAIMRFGAHGALLGSLEKRGSGPGEFRGVSALAFGRGHLHVIDQGNLRYSVLSPDLRLVRETPLREVYPLPLGLVITTSGRTIVNGRLRAAGSNRPVLHEIDTLGALVSSFDSVDVAQERARGFPNAETRILAPARHDRLWVARSDAYDVSLWQLDPPHRLLQLKPRANWFDDAGRSKRSARPGAPESSVAKAPPPPAVLGVQEDSAGLLWILGRTTNKDWQRYSDSREGRTLEMYSGVIDVIDPRHGARIIASVRLPFIGRFVGPQIIGRYQESPKGYPYIELYRVHLRGYTPEQAGGVAAEMYE